jgi:hypothetical protein
MTIKTAWTYDYVKPSRGKTLLLLTPDELELALPCISQGLKMRFANKAESKKFFKKVDVKTLTSRVDQLHSHLNRVKRIILNGTYDDALAAHDDLFNDIHVINISLNHIFSDDGWRYVRKLMSQAIKRQKSSRLYVDFDVNNRLQKYIELHGLSTANDAIDQLLADSVKQNELDYSPPKT